MRYQLYILLLLFLPLSSCFSGVELYTPRTLPEERPDELLIHFSSNGGMVMQSEDIYLHEDSSSFRYNYNGAFGSTKIRMSEKELDRIYNIIRDNFFEDIETEQKNIADRGGITITLIWDENKISVSNSGMNFVKDEWHEEWNNIVNAFTAIKETQKTIGSY
jgi:hypothetical protein